MNTITMPLFSIDTLQFSKRLQQAGMQQQIADELAESIKEAHSQSTDSLATKYDLKIIDQKIDLLGKKVDVLEQKISVLAQKIDTIEHRLTLKIFLMLTAAVGFITWLDRIVN